MSHVCVVCKRRGGSSVGEEGNREEEQRMLQQAGRVYGTEVHVPRFAQEMS